MEVFIATDLHGKEISLPPNTDLVFIIGDFSKGEKLREVVFGKGKIEEAKEEILKSAQFFLKNLPKGTIIVPGNIEKLCLNEISKIAQNLGHHFLENKIFKIGELKILGLKFFMEEEWVKSAHPNNKDKIKRAKKEEKEIRDFLKANSDANIILSHLPPYGILDEDPNPLKIIPKNYPKNCGSKILLKYIKENHPKLVICGHIHIPGEIKIKETKIINPGEGRLISI